MNDALLQYRQNTLGHEFLHCLGLTHPSYKSLKENKAHRSIMEDITPIVKSCQKKQLYGKTFLKCVNTPAMPTGDDICTLSSLYGSSTNESSICQEITEKFLIQYSSVVTLETASYSNTHIDEL